MTTQTPSALDLSSLSVAELYDMRDEAEAIHRQHAKRLAELQAECLRRYEDTSAQIRQSGYIGPSRISRGRRAVR